MHSLNNTAAVKKKLKSSISAEISGLLNKCEQVIEANINFYDKHETALEAKLAEIFDNG